MNIKHALLKIGGSILSKNQDCENGFFQFDNAQLLSQLIVQNLDRAGCVIGGGYLNKWFLNELLRFSAKTPVNDQHYVGISAINTNAEFFRIVFSQTLANLKRFNELYPNVLRYSDLESPELLKKTADNYKYSVIGANKPGHSSDFNAITLALALNIDTIISLKNIDGVYTADPRKDINAEFIKEISWQDYLNLIGATEHIPRGNYPVDPVSAKRAKSLGIKFIIVDGENLSNLRDLVMGKSFRGSIIA